MYLDYMFGTMDSYAKIGLAEGLTSGAGRKDPDDAGRSYLHSNKKEKVTKKKRKKKRKEGRILKDTCLTKKK